MVKMVSKGPYMEFLRAYVLQPTANSYVEQQIPTPTSKTENMAMLIHSIELVPSYLVDTVPANTDMVQAHLAKTSTTAVKTIKNPDILAHYLTRTILNAVFNGTTTNGAELTKFDPPILYPHANLFFGFSTLGLGTVIDAVCRIGYTLQKVSREDFISALVE